MALIQVESRVFFGKHLVWVALWIGLGWSAQLLTSPLSHAHGTFHDRIKHVNQQIKDDPLNPGLYLNRAGIYRNHGDWDAALADIDHASQLDPDRPDVDYFRGQVFLRANNPQKAEAALRRFLESAPHHTAARVARAQALAKLNRYMEAAEDYRDALEYALVPIPEYYLEYARVLVSAGAGYRKEAIRVLDEGVARLGLIITLELAAIELEVEQGLFDEALARLERAARRLPRQEAWLMRRGGILERAGRTKEARASFQQVLIEISKLSSQRQKTSAMTQMKLQASEAIERLARSWPRSGQSAESLKSEDLR